MNDNFDIIAISEGKVIRIEFNGLTTIGGQNSSGICLPNLSNNGDYAILARQGHNLLAIHPLTGRKRQPHILAVGHSFQVADLTLAILPKLTTENRSYGMEVLQESLAQLAREQDSEKPLGHLLNGIMKLTKHEKGLVISKNIRNQFEVLVGNNISAHKSWISDSLVQDCLQSQTPKFLNNVIGSNYSSSQSLVSTGLLSVFCWPLIFKGQALGVLITGSRSPHEGLSSADTGAINTLLNLAAVLSDFRLKELSLQSEIQGLRAAQEDGPFQSQSSSVRQTSELALQVADSDLSILIQGETGVGKEVLARWIHQKSSRAKGPFITVNCAAIPSDLLESLLFGHKKGSFTHAFQDSVGKIQQAHGGTLFLDEIGDLPPLLQPKLLRVLNDKMIEPIGSPKAQSVDVRILTATHKSLKNLVAEKVFRDDLYYRLAEMTLWIPPLRDRPADILLIATNWLKELSSDKILAEDARRWLVAQPWSGNVRELKSAIKRAVVLTPGKEIHMKHFLLGREGAPSSAPLSQNWLGGKDLEQAKQSFILEKINLALEQTGGNRTKAAALLGITARTLFRYLEDDMKTLS